MSKFLKTLWADESGAAGAEYALLLAIVALGITLAAEGLSGAISGAMSDATSCINSGSAGSGC